MHIIDIFKSKQFKEAGPETAQLLIDNCRATLKENNADCHVFTLTQEKFLYLFENILGLLHMPKLINEYFEQKVLTQEMHPRKYNYEPSYFPRTGVHWRSNDESASDPPSDHPDKANLYALTKFHHFMTEPFEKFRVPFGINISSDLKNYVIHPGNARLISMDFLPLDRPMKIFITDLHEGHVELKNMITELGLASSEYCFSRKTDEELIEDLELEDYSQVSVYFGSVIGLQIVEHHPLLEEFNQEYEIEFTGSAFIVNGVELVKLNTKTSKFEFSKNFPSKLHNI